MKEIRFTTIISDTYPVTVQMLPQDKMYAVPKNGHYVTRRGRFSFTGKMVLLHDSFYCDMSAITNQTLRYVGTILQLVYFS